MPSNPVAEYLVEVFHTDRGAWQAELEDSLAQEIRALGVHRVVQVQTTVTPAAGRPTVGVYFGSQSAITDASVGQRVATAIGRGSAVIPVVDSLANFTSQVPLALQRINGWEWSGGTPGIRLARRVLEELGIEDRRRRVFVSHKRDDGLAAAEQLHDYLSHNGFEPFIDRFAIRPGQDVQRTIADTLEDYAFLLLVETPEAHTSAWVFDEVEYALSHQMGMHIVTWPGNIAEVPATAGLPRQRMSPNDLRHEKGYEIFTDEALDEVLAHVEAIHANAIARRRRYLLRSVEDAVGAASGTCTPLESWRVLVEGPTGGCIVQVSARLPTVEDLYALDAVLLAQQAPQPPGLLVHAARVLPDDSKKLLTWAAGAKAITLIPENAVGGYGW